MPAEPLPGSTVKVGRNRWYLSPTTLTRDDQDSIELAAITKVRLDLYRKYLIVVETNEDKLHVLARSQKSWRPFAVRLLRQIHLAKPGLRIHRREGAFTIWLTFAVMLFIFGCGCFVIILGFTRPELPGAWVGWLFLIMALPGMWHSRPWNAARHYSTPSEIADAFEERGVSMALWHLNRDATKRTRQAAD